MKVSDKIYSPFRLLSITVLNILIAYIVFAVCRLVFYIANISYFPNIGIDNLIDILRGGFAFDTAGIMYVNVLYIVLMLIPLRIREKNYWQKTAKWTFVITNSIAVIANLVDTVYFRYTNRRTTASVFSEFSQEENLLRIFGTEILNNILLVIIGIAMIFALWKFYTEGDFNKTNRRSVKDILVYYLISLVVFIAGGTLWVGGVRGGFAHSTRPITISNANQYVDSPIETAIVLNTPFSIIRTIGKTVYEKPNYFSSNELNAKYSPVHEGNEGELKELNVVIIILESVGQEYIDYGYAPFLKQLQDNSLSFKNSFSNGKKSIDAMPSVLSSIPMFIEPYIVTHYSTNNVSGIAAELNKVGYHSAFFHGAPNGSMGFQAFARTTGWKEYYGMTEYNNNDDFDGMWAIWDEPFLQFFANKMSEFEEPFVTSVFTASSHHPFKLPEEYESVYTEEGGHPIHKCVRYTDNALKKFFETAEKQDWYKNTLFVITADHTNASSHNEYKGSVGSFRVPIIFYMPDSDMKGRRETTAQQIDIMPSILEYLNYPNKYVAFGKNLFDDTLSNNWAVNYNNGMYQYFEDNYMLQFDGKKPFALYDFENDIFLKNNILNKSSKQDEMLDKTKAIIQQYIERMIDNNLVVEE